MNRQNVFSRIELLFLNFVIFALSRPATTLTSLRHNLSAVGGSDLKSMGILLCISGTAGLICGCLAYFISIQIR